MASDAGKGPEPRPVQDRESYNATMRAIYGTRVRIPGGEDRAKLVNTIADEIMAHYSNVGLVVNSLWIRQSVEKTLGFLEDHC